MSFSNAYETNILTWTFTASAVTRPTSWTLALYTVAPGEAGGGTEVTGGSYARTAVTFSVSGDTATNSAAVEFPAATANWGTVVAVGVFDNSSALVAYANLSTSRTVNSGDVFRIPSGDLDIVLT
jgi:hypothetical protein